MATEILPFTESDIPAAVRLQLDAFKDHPRTPMMWPNGYADDLYAYYEANRKKDFHDPECRFMKAVNSETGELIGVSEWTFILDPQPNIDVIHEGGAEPPANWPKGGNWAMRRWYKINLQRLLKASFGNEPYIRVYRR